ncbi:preprotein translocase subunit SecA [Yinghuangia soli]|uniref:Protein translocase subunit SecA n=1 Tax=Yinghuangia soli TaxID=2908204 RepID=A0AA41QAU8_9ACTN|nr:preprotein translocase subunit SecA [Yinghuangia soli]MCF2533916.1 preprotein translocase subunit SecA [Yinghuangia soli]
MSIFDKVLRAGEGKILRKLTRIADQVDSIEEDFTNLSDAELRALTDEYKERYADGESLDDLLPEAFATVREAARRTLGQRHYKVQLMGGAALHLGNIAEMRTGEGKTLVSTLPAYLNAIAGKGVHVVTVNDYLAERDSEWMGRVHRFLGLTVGCILANMPPHERRKAYNCDITYGTNNEFGFDYLRDNMAWSQDELVQRGHFFAVVDEVDSILIDEARTPLIISGPADQATKWYADFAKLVTRLKRAEPVKDPLETPVGDYEVDEKKRTVGILEAGVNRVEDYLGIDNLYEAVNTPLVGYLNNAIKAKELYKRDKEYVVVDGEVLIVDEHTGRILAGRRYNEGMHQAIEAKEGVEIKDENQTLATITLQNFFRLYDKLGGMTGTAMTEAAEFHQIYKLGVVPIPTHRNVQRLDQADLVYKTEEAKFAAVVDDIVEKHEKGQPVLVGTTSVEKSEYLSNQLRKRGVPHEVLNAKHHEREAQIVAQAGRKGAVTVATNMAGRGTDIMLGGNPDHLASAALAQRGLSAVETPEDYEAAWPDALENAKKAVKAEHEEVTELGGLYVLGTERHESRRIDNQLRGRSGRQGDPGESRFYLSLGDDLMRLFKANIVEAVLNRAGIPEDVPIESKMVSNAIKSAQSQVEQQNFEIRKNVLKYDEVLNRQREVIYGERRRVLDGEDLHEQVEHFIDDTISAYVTGATEGFAEEWDLEKLWTNLKQLYPVSITIEEVEEEAGDRSGLDVDTLVEQLQADAQASYEEREEKLGAEVMRELERRVVLSVLDRRWREHLYEMDYLQEGIGLRAMAQRDPLVEYQREGFDMFNAMMEGIKEESVGYLFNVEVQIEQVPEAPSISMDKVQAMPEIHAKGLETPQRPTHLSYSAPSVDGEGGVVTTEEDLDVDDVIPEQGGTRAERRRAQRARNKKKR